MTNAHTLAARETTSTETMKNSIITHLHATSDLSESPSSPFLPSAKVNGNHVNRIIKERDDARREAEEFRDDMRIHLTEGDARFTWENREKTP